jgi:uncharacterized damage-inducible protein DinB
MSTPSRKAQMIEQVRAAHEPLEAQLAALGESQMMQPGVNGEWSVKDLLAHITWWEEHLLRRLRTGRDDLFFEGVNPRAATDRANAEVFAANQSRLLADVQAEFHASYQEVLSALESIPEGELASEEMYQVVGSDTFQHYPEHSEAIRAWVASGAAGSA